MYDHCIQYDHSFDQNNMKVLHLESKGRKVNALEILEINKAITDNKNLINIQISMSSALLK